MSRNVSAKGVTVSKCDIRQTFPCDAGIKVRSGEVAHGQVLVRAGAHETYMYGPPALDVVGHPPDQAPGAKRVSNGSG